MRVLIAAAASLLACNGEANGPQGPAEPTSATSSPSELTIVDRPECDGPLPQRPVVPVFGSLVSTVVDEQPLLYHVPDAPRGLAFGFHGSGGDVAQLDNIEWVRLYNELHCAGIGIIIGEAAGQHWDTSLRPDNGDFARLSDLRDTVIDETEATADLPVFGVGFSNGGHFATAFAQLAREAGWDLRAVSLHNSPGLYLPEVAANYHTSENDTSVDNGNVQRAQRDHATQGLDGGLYAFDELVIDREYFKVLNEFDAEESGVIFDDLVAYGLLSNDGVRLVEDINDIERALDAWAEDTTAVRGPARVTLQMRVAWATHRFSGAFADADRALFAAQLD